MSDTSAPAALLAAIDKTLAYKPSGAMIAAAPVLTVMARLLAHCRRRIEADAAWPSHAEELTRKATDTAHALMHRLSAGEITRQAAAEGLGAIIDTASGLMDPGALNVINAAYRSLRA